MAVELDNAAGAEAISFEEFTARLDEQGADLSHSEGVEIAASLLARLYVNREFLAARAIEELKQRCVEQSEMNRYGAQVLMLHRSIGRHFVRANFWPALDDPIVQASGPQHYLYHTPHDHNFDFVTLGYFGPGYGSNWYDYDNDRIVGFAGENANLRFVEKGVLSSGRMLHYRAHRDVHDQLPPAKLSISLNIIPELSATAWRDQYMFDLESNQIASITTVGTNEIALRIAAALSDNGLDLAHDYARRHPSDRVRWQAWRAIAGAATGRAGRLAQYEAATSDTSSLVRAEAATMVRALVMATEKQGATIGTDVGAEN